MHLYVSFTYLQDRKQMIILTSIEALHSHMYTHANTHSPLCTCQSHTSCSGCRQTMERSFLAHCVFVTQTGCSVDQVSSRERSLCCKWSFLHAAFMCRGAAVKALKNKTICSYITLCGDQTGLSLKQRKVMCKLAEQLKIVCSAFSQTHAVKRENRESGKESD